eukprot:scaffold518_cov388-Prasinococcus_capsulatus_cf.AAC.44
MSAAQAATLVKFARSTWLVLIGPTVPGASTRLASIACLADSQEVGSRQTITYDASDIQTQTEETALATDT